jgi:hypothetical protein
MGNAVAEVGQSRQIRQQMARRTLEDDVRWEEQTCRSIRNSEEMIIGDNQVGENRKTFGTGRWGRSMNRPPQLAPSLGRYGFGGRSPPKAPVLACARSGYVRTGPRRPVGA